MTKKPISTHFKTPKTLLLGVYRPTNKFKNPQHYYDEFISLVKTLGVTYEETLFIKVRSIDKAYFFTKGKMQEVVDFCNENEIEHVICSEILTPLQERNLENVLDCRIFDREELILEIFKKAAVTAEGKIQVEMAQIEFLKTRLSGKGKEFAQQEGRIGGKGAGETAKELLKRFFADRLRQSKKRLETLRKSRDVQRKQRLDSNTPLVCLVGYTNAGKSTLLNSLTKSDVLAESKLFATLDTTTRELFLYDKKKVLLSDTVGFISQLPHHLIEAFQATLEELKYAQLLLHVVDSSNPAWPDHVEVVNKTLSELDVTVPILYVFNKVDLLNKQERKALDLELLRFTPNVVTHAQDKEGIKILVRYLRSYDFAGQNSRST